MAGPEIQAHRGGVFKSTEHREDKMKEPYLECRK